MKADWLKEAARAGVFHLSADARELAGAAAASGLMVIYVDIGHAHDKEDFLAGAAKAMRFPGHSSIGWEAFANGLKDLAWMPSNGWVVILERSKHFAGGHASEFKAAMAPMAAAADHWRAAGKSFWTFIGGPEGWKSGWPDMPSG